MTTNSRFVLILSAYTAAAIFGLQWGTVSGAGSPIWPAAGIGLSALVLCGAGYWPAVFLGRLLASIVVGSDLPVLVELAIATSNVCATAGPAWALRRTAGFEPNLPDMRSVLLLTTATAIGSALSAVIGSLALALSVGLGGDVASRLFVLWMLASFVGALVPGTVILALADRWNWAKARHVPTLLHGALILAVASGLSYAIFLGADDSALRAWHLYPVLIWAALSGKVRLASIVLLVMTVASIYGATQAFGPFADLSTSVTGRILIAQQFLAITCPCVLVLAAAADERRIMAITARSEARLRAVLESTGDSVFVVDTDWRFTYLNARAEAQIAEGRNLIGISIWDAFPQAVGTGFEAAYRKAVESGNPTRVDEHYAPLNAWYQANAYPSADGLTVFFRDVTEERKLEAAYRTYDAQMRAVLEQMPIGVTVADVPSGNTRFRNAKAVEILGDAQNPVPSQDPQAPAGAPNHDGTAYALDQYPPFRSVRRGETIARESMTYRRPDGTFIHLEVSAVPIRDATGVPSLVVSTLEDVTERRLQERALSESEARYRELADSMPQLVWSANPEGVVDYYNSRVAAYAGASQDEEGLWHWEGLLHPDDLEQTAQAWSSALKTGTEYQSTHRVKMRDGTYRWHLSRGRPVRDATGRITRWFGTATDIQDLRMIEEQLRQREAQLQRNHDTFYHLIQNNPFGIYIVDSAFRLQQVSLGAQKVFANVRPLIGRDFDEVLRTIWPQPFADEASRHFRHTLDTGEPYAASRMVERREDVDEVESYDWRIERITLPDGAFGAVCYFYDLSERQRFEANLRESEERFRNMAEHAPVMVWVTEADGNCTYLSKSWYDFTGHTPETGLGHGWLNAVHPDDRDETERVFREATAAKCALRLEYRLRAHDGSYRWAIDAAAPRLGRDGAFLGFIGSVIDISDRKEAEAALQRLNAELEQRVEENTARLVQLQKTESLGQLTGGLAHDFNNLLMAILSSLELVRKRISTTDRQTMPLVENAIQGAQRGAALTQRLLAFARKQELQPEPVAVGSLIQGMEELLQRSLGPLIRIETHRAQDVPPALVDPNQLEMAILNLAVNARDAMPNGGQLSIALDSKDAGPADGLAHGRYVRIRMTDTGTGMDMATLRRAVEPFFTTKGVGKGTGLGLAMVHGLTAQSGGKFSLESRLGHGTTAEILLPVAGSERTSAQADVTLSMAAEKAEAVDAARRSLSVLLVDDDVLIRMSTAAMIEDLGHVPVEAQSGREALDILTSGHSVDVVVTDQAMPEMTGLQFVAVARQHKPDLPVILASGYAELPDEAIGGRVLRLGKPYRQDQLAAALSTVFEMDA